MIINIALGVALGICLAVGLLAVIFKVVLYLINSRKAGYRKWSRFV